MSKHCKNARELKSFLVDDNGRVRRDRWNLFKSECQEGNHGLSNYSIQDLAIAFMGRDEWKNEIPGLRHVRESSTASNEMEMLESPVNSTFFPQITGQLLFSEVRQGFEQEAGVFRPLVPVIPSVIKNTEIVPQISRVDPDLIESVGEGQSYPRLHLGEHYNTLPAKTKKGGIIELTRESVVLDKTNTLVEKARSVGEAHGAVVENEIIDCLIGQTNNYSRDGTAANTYTTTGVINNQSSTALLDWTDVDSALRLFDAILDPDTSEPLSFRHLHLIVSPAKLFVARRIMAATQSRYESDPSAANNEVTVAGSPLAGMSLQVLSSVRLNRRILAGPEGTQSIADDGWFLGDLSKLLAFYEIWPLELMQKGAESEASFDRDVAIQYKSSHYGVCAVREKRFMARLENTAW